MWVCGLSLGKLDARGETSIYIGTGYELKQSGYLICLSRLRKTVVAEHVLFDETLCVCLLLLYLL